MPYILAHKPSYDAQFIDLPKDLQRRITQAQLEIEAAPMAIRGNTIKKLQGYKDLYRYRLDDYRLIYSVNPTQNLVQLLAVGPRKDVYERFDYDPDNSERPELTWFAEPERDRAPEWQMHPEWFGPKQAPTAERLPRKLSPSLLRQWLIPEEYHTVLMRCTTDDDLLKSGVPNHVLERVFDVLWPPDADLLKDEPDLVLFRSEDLERYAEGDLLGFLLKLDETQRRYCSWALGGPTLLKGGPGSGKSTVALYRVRALIEKAVNDSTPLPHILFTTYTNPLISFSESLLCQLLSDLIPLPNGKLPQEVCVRTVDSVAKRIAERGENRALQMATNRQSLDALRTALVRLQPKGFGDGELLGLSKMLQGLRDEYLLAEIDWVIEGQGCQSEEDYLRANRGGRLVGLDKEKRIAIWRLYCEFREELSRQGLVSWGQARQLALQKARSGALLGRWDYVIVDEAQDLTPTALAFCVELCKSPQGIFLTADANQSLYNRAFRWQQAHEQLKVAGRTRLLKRNYRSTLEIALAARGMLDDKGGADDEALDQEFVHRGRPPIVHGADGAIGQAKWLAERIFYATKELRLSIGAAAVLVPTNRLGETFAELLSQRGLPAQFMQTRGMKPAEGCVKVMTLHAAKGLEFPIVAIAHVEADRLPRLPDTSDEAERQECLAEQLRLFFVGCTRAMRYLFVTHDRALPSEFIDRLSDKHWIWER